MMKLSLKNQKLSHVYIAPILAMGVLLSSCTDSPESDQDITISSINEASFNSDARANANKVQEIFYAVPSPMEMASILKKSGAQYDMNLLHDVKKVNEYTTSRSRALNLGVYGADLSYASIFNQNQESIIYLSCSKKLADNLGVTKAFDDTTIERMETNIDNRDSLLNIVSETYFMLDAYLKENERDHLSAMVIAAGWVEGLFLATAIADKCIQPDDNLLKRIAEQKLSLDNLSNLVNAYNKDRQLDEIADDLAKISVAYANVNIDKEETKVSKAADGITTIGGKTQTSISTETLEEITRVVSEIRGRYVS